MSGMLSLAVSLAAGHLKPDNGTLLQVESYNAL